MKCFESACVLAIGAGAVVSCFLSVFPPGASGFLAPAVPIRATRHSTGVTRSTVYGRSSQRMVVAEGISFGELDGSDVRVGIISTRWNGEIVDRLTQGVKDALKGCNVTDSNIFETQVPGSFELPLAARFLALSQTVDAVVCVGCLIKGETMHFEYIAEATCHGLMDVSILTSTPMVLGVLTCLNEEQAIARSTGDNNHGVGWGKTAVEMGLLRMSATGMAKKTGGRIGFGKSMDEAQKEKQDALPGSSPKPKIGF